VIKALDTSEFTFFSSLSGHVTLAAGGCCWQKAAQRQPTSCSKHAVCSMLFEQSMYTARNFL
jgi:hypothetical protein